MQRHRLGLTAGTIVLIGVLALGIYLAAGRDTQLQAFVQEPVTASRTLIAGAVDSTAAGDVTAAEPGATAGWTHIQVDTSRERFNSNVSYFGLAMVDVTGDGYQDIVSGKYFYRNPGGDMAGSWQRVTFPLNVDAVLAVDVDGDAQADVIAIALPDVYWIEAQDSQGNSWTTTKIAAIPATTHVNGQGHTVAQIIAGGKPEILLAAGSGDNEIYYLSIPANPGAGNWPKTRITNQATDEGIGVGDIDGDGDLDVAAGDMHTGGQYIAWFENPANGAADWTKHRLGTFDGVWPDRVAIADINGDSRLDVVVSEENDGSQPNARVYWYQQPADPKSTNWTRRTVITQYTTNSLDVVDIDDDGDADIVAGEHRGSERLKLLKNVNDGASWEEEVVDSGKESHLGAKTSDLDGDGDLDIASIAWDNYGDLHVWRNDTTETVGDTKVNFTYVEVDNVAGDCKMVGDIDGDGFADLVIGGSPGENLHWYRYPNWQKSLIATPGVEFTTDGKLGDVDGDGDLDVVVPDGNSGNNLVWFKNPRPAGNPAVAAQWQRLTIGATGNWGKDVQLADYDGDGRLDVATRRDNEAMIFFQTAPATWSRGAFSNVQLGNEGMASGDIDKDGDVDLVLQGVWLRNPGGSAARTMSSWTQHTIGPANSDFKALVVDLNKDGRQDVLFSSSENTADVDWWSHSGNPTGAWTKHTIVQQLERAHTLQAADMDLDGTVDVVLAQMHTSSQREIFIMLNEGGNALNWRKHSLGNVGLHNGVVADIGNDGKNDLFGANWTGNPPLKLWLNTTQISSPPPPTVPPPSTVTPVPTRPLSQTLYISLTML